MTKSNNRPRLHANFQDLMQYSIRTENGCIEWQGARVTFGYGTFRINRKYETLHRYVLKLTKGEPFPKAWALHSCDNPPCINPDHLRWGTGYENAMDRKARDRDVWSGTRGERIHTSKINEDTVRLIRALYSQGKKSPEIASIVGLGSRQVLLIVRRKSWKWVD